MATRWRFPFAKAVPSDDALAQWVTGLGLGLNDLVHSHKRLFEGLAGDEPTVVEIGYDARLTGSHVWEVSVLLRAGTSNPDLSDFLAGLPASVRADLDAAVAIFDDPEKAAFRGALGRARDHFFHYPEPGRKELRRALAAFGRDGHDGELWLDSDLRNARARWADDVAAQLFVRAEATTTQRSGNSPRSLGTSRGCRCTCWWTSSRSTSARSRTASSRKSRTADRTGLDGVRAGARGFGRRCPGGRVAADVA